MAKYNIYGHVLYSEIEYEKLMRITEKIFIQSLMSRIPGIEEWVDDIWNNIDHEYMINTLEEIKRDIIQSDLKTYLAFKELDNEKPLALIDEILKTTNGQDDLFKINPIKDFKHIEKKYAQKIIKDYKKRIETIDDVDEMEYLTAQIKNFHKLEQTIVYSNGRSVTPSTYLSLLYNVNLTRTGWNQTFKDADYFNRDLMILETHRLSCPLCAPMQGKIYSKSGKSKEYPSIEVAYKNGVGHPNCKCEFSIYWDKLQLETQSLAETKPGEYEEDQKKKAIDRKIRELQNDKDLYRMIGNEEEADKTQQKIRKLRDKLNG